MLQLKKIWHQYCFCPQKYELALQLPNHFENPNSRAVNAIYEPYVDSQISDHQETHIFQMNIPLAEAGEIGVREDVGREFSVVASS